MHTNVPWGLTRMTDRLPESPPLYATVHLDPATQTGVFRDAQGAVIDMGGRGTNKTKGTTSKSGGGGGDGKGPKPETQDDHTTDYESD